MTPKTPSAKTPAAKTTAAKTTAAKTPATQKTRPDEDRSGTGDTPLIDGPDLPMYTIRDLDQLKILGDPLRMRILEAFVRSPGTTKQVAQALGEPPTKLYHHVDALERAGLIELRSTRQNRGTLEKHFGAVARAFRVDPDLLPSQLEPGPVIGLGTELLQRALDEYRKIEASTTDDPDSWQDYGSKSMLTMAEVHAEDHELEELQGRIEALLGPGHDPSELQVDAPSGSEEEAPRRSRYRLLIALYPLDPPETDSDGS